MGRNLALHLTKHKVTVSHFNTSASTLSSASSTTTSPDNEKNIHLFTQDYHSFLASLSIHPRLIILCVPQLMSATPAFSHSRWRRSVAS